MADVRIGCKSCGKKVLMDLMKYDPDSRKSLICPECYSSKVAKKASNSRTRRLLLSMQGRKQSSRQTGPSDRYKCGTCGYEFKRGLLSRQAPICPYCGKPAIKKQKVYSDWTKGI